MQPSRHGYRWLAVFYIALLAACATPYQTHQLRNSTPDIPSTIELTSVPFYPQLDYLCGPAALATVINQVAQLTTPDQLLPLVYIPGLKGSLQIELMAATKHYGLLAVQLDGHLESILQEVAHGNPVLVMQNLGLESYPFWHYAVVVGYDLKSEQIILRSGEIQRLVRPFSVFERTWERAAYWSMVVVPPDKIPATATEDKYISAAIAFESSGLHQSVLSAYKSGIQRWPGSFVLQMGLGNAYHALQDYKLAEKAFRTAIDLNPLRAEAWNNIAFALIKQGKKHQAIEAVDQAINLQPDDIEYKSSKLEIYNHP